MVVLEILFQQITCALPDDACSAHPHKPQVERGSDENLAQEKQVDVINGLSIKELADKMKMQPSVIVKKLFLQGQIVTVNQEITFEEAEKQAIAASDAEKDFVVFPGTNEKVLKTLQNGQIVTRVDNYTQVVDCINSIHDLVMSYHESTKLVDELSTALANIQQRERIFTKKYLASSCRRHKEVNNTKHHT